ncbi:MAG: hypothetical protein JNN30_03495 [Rhodanobacteraceae bacterium]|nr:hypothetical protein [Rhodanobacteraceae bacterium]
MNPVFRCLLKLAVLTMLPSGAAFAQSSTTCDQNCSAPYVPNEFWTTPYGPAAANIVLSPTNFLACTSTAYALCYYSGPDAVPKKKRGVSALPALPCNISANDPNIADCRCYAESGVSYVDIHSIRNTEAYIETIRACGINGEKCRNLASDELSSRAMAVAGGTPPSLPTAPVCNYLQANAEGRTPMAPDAELVSTFSFARVKSYGVVPTDCTGSAAPYAGCMTASCTFERDAKGKPNGFATCRCPIFTGPYQVGQAGVSCDAGEGNVWSAAYTPPPANGGQ